jgi:GWxTD domain-containing protein
MASPFFVFNHKVFYVPGEGTVVETYLEFHGKSVAMSANEDGFLMGNLEVTTIFRHGDEVVAFDKKVLETPWMQPDNIVDFLDVQRFKVPPGSYTVEVQLNDLNAAENAGVKFEMELIVPQPEAGLFFSDVEMVMGYKKTEEVNIYSKSGYDLLPMVSDDYVGVSMNEIIFYGELYNTDQLGSGEKFLLHTYIAHAETGDPMPDTQKYERKNSNLVVPVLGKVNIAELESGDYFIVLEARNRENEVIARREHPFRRNYKGKEFDLTTINDEFLRSTWVNLYDDKIALYEHMLSTRPIADGNERYSMESTFLSVYERELADIQRYFYAFWEKRQPGNSEAAWLEYKEKVDFVQEKYGTRNKRGYETDRGRVYLEYGEPIDISDRANEPSSLPYQIWRYYKAGRFNNVRFVFYDPNLTNQDYILLHCESIPGEIRNPQWRLILEQRNTPMNDVDRRNGRDHFGGRVDDFFDNPR